MRKTNNQPKSLQRAGNKIAGFKKQVKKETKESKLQRLVKTNPHFEFLANGKIKCILTKHQFLPTIENYQAYLKSKSYKKGIQSQIDLTDYQDYLIPHKQSQHFLFCKLTGAKLPKKKTAIERHINSRKFQFRLKEVQKTDEDAEEREPEEEGNQFIEEVEEEEEVEDQ